MHSRMLKSSVPIIITITISIVIAVAFTLCLGLNFGERGQQDGYNA